MKYNFISYLQQSGTRTFTPIPFNVWDTLNQKGNIPCRIQISDNSFECKLIPKGNGIYWIPIPKSIVKTIQLSDAISVSMEPIQTLSRINSNSPYSKDNPIRIIDSITPIPVTPGFCGHGCVAMLAGVEINDVITLMGKEHASWSKIIEALDYYGISHKQKPVYPKDESYVLPKCCIVYNDNSFLLWYSNFFCGTDNIDLKKTVCYLEILTD